MVNRVMSVSFKKNGFPHFFAAKTRFGHQTPFTHLPEQWKIGFSSFYSARQDTSTDPMVTLAVNDNWVECTLHFVTDFMKRRSTKDKLFFRILQDVEATGNRESSHRPRSISWKPPRSKSAFSRLHIADPAHAVCMVRFAEKRTISGTISPKPDRHQVLIARVS